MSFGRYSDVMTSWRSVQEKDANGKDLTFSLVYNRMGTAGFVWIDSSRKRVPKPLQIYLFGKYNPQLGKFSGKLRKGDEYTLEDLANISNIDLKKIRKVFGSDQENHTFNKQGILAILEHRWRELEDWLVNPDPLKAPTFRQTGRGKYDFDHGNFYKGGRQSGRKYTKNPDEIKKDGVTYFSMAGIVRKIHEEGTLKHQRLGKFSKAIKCIVQGLEEVVKKGNGYYVNGDVKESVMGIASDEKEVDKILSGVTIKDVANGLGIFEDDVKELIRNKELACVFSRSEGLVTSRSYEVLKSSWTKDRAEEYRMRTLKKKLEEIEKRP